MSTKKLLTLLLFLLLACAFVLTLRLLKGRRPGSGSGESQSELPAAGPPRGTLNLRLSSEPTTLNNLVHASITEKDILQTYLYPPLLRFDPDTLELLPETAESLPAVSPDRLTYTFTIRRGIRFTDGMELKAENFRFSYEFMMSPDFPATGLQENFKDLKAVEVVDEYAVRFRFSRPFFRAMILAGIDFPIVPKHLLDGSSPKDIASHPIGKSPVGYGPYKLVEWNPGEKMVFERNDQYWMFADSRGTGKYNFRSICYRFVPDFSEAVRLLETGAIDVLPLEYNQWKKLDNDGGLNGKFQVLEYNTPFFNYIGWNNASPFFADSRVRQAMTLMLRRKEILDKYFPGHGEIVTCCFYINSNEYSRNLAPLPFDPEQAKKLLDESGWVDFNGNGTRDREGTEFQFELLTSSGEAPWRQELENSFVSDLKSVGVECRVVPLPWADLLDRIAGGRFDAYLIGLIPAIAMADPYDIWHSYEIPPAGQNYVRYRNPLVDRILEEARAEFDNQKRIALYRTLNEIVHQDEPWSFLYAMPTLTAVNKKILNVKVHKLGLRPEEWFLPETQKR
jgi:peptide/nickel transport system substrate-binding protein